MRDPISALRRALTLTVAVSLLCEGGSTRPAEALTGKRRAAPRLPWLETPQFVAQLATSAWLGGLQAARSIADMQKVTMDSAVEVMFGRQSPAAAMWDMQQRGSSALSYPLLVNTVGRRLWGSAHYPGEEVLTAEHPHFRLSYIPPQGTHEHGPGPVFHVGGFLPQGDLVFRALPEASFLGQLSAHGIPVYAMELRRDGEQASPGSCTLETMIDAVSAFSDLAFEHAGRERMTIEGYCGLGLQTLAYLAAKPEEVDAKFRAAKFYVAPVDGRVCRKIGQLVDNMPQELKQAAQGAVASWDNAIPGLAVMSTIDLALDSWLAKTPWGQMEFGWRKGHYAGLPDDPQQWSPADRRDVAGGFWTSAANAWDSPMPHELAALASGAWTDGVGPHNGYQLAGSYRGQPISLEAIRDATGLFVLGFYGRKDAMVPVATFDPISELLPGRSKVFEHEHAGHVTYSLSPGQWDPNHPRPLDPHPVEVMRSLVAP